MAKKLIDKTPWERVEPRLRGLTNKEAEEVGIRILAQCVAKVAYTKPKKEGVEYFTDLMDRLSDAADEWAKNNSLALAMCKVININHE